MEIKNRQNANFGLVRKLSELVIAYPDLRFGQILVNFGFIEYENHIYGTPVLKDLFQEESEVTLNRVKNGRNIERTDEH